MGLSNPFKEIDQLKRELDKLRPFPKEILSQLNREYINALEKAHQGEVRDFTALIAGTVRETLRDTLRFVY